jgi:hypothetical protein
MPRRSRRAERTLAWALLGLGLVAACVTAPARAELAGAVDVRPLIGVDSRYGAAALAELWARRKIVRPGVAFGLGALSKNDDASSRIVTPLAFSLAVMPSMERTGFVGVIRLGGYAGAEKGGFIGGGFVSGTLGCCIALGEGASLRLAVDVWGLIGKRGGVFLGPALGLGF